MSDDPIVIWWSWGCWLFGLRFDRHEVGLCIGPLNISIMPSKFGRSDGR